MIRDFLHFIVSRRNLGVLVGVAALCLLILLFGDRLYLLGDQPLAGFWTRVWWVLLILAVWLAIEAFLWWRQVRADMGVLKLGLGEGRVAGEESVSAELAEMRENLREVIAMLRRERPGQGRQFLMGLPWYLVVGPHAGGKTTLIAESGLTMPLEDRLGGGSIVPPQTVTHWRWWFTDEALFIAGAASLPQQAWRALCTFVQRGRSRRPLDGVIAVVPVEALLAGQAQEIGNGIRRRLQDAMRHFAARLPIYVVLSQCDRLLGFSDFFARLDADALTQPFGVALPVPGGSSVPAGGQATLQGRLQQLVATLGEQLPSRAAIEPDPVVRARMALLPEQLASVLAASLQFANELMMVGRSERPLLLRGVFLTSAARAGDDAIDQIDAWGDRFAQAVGLAAMPQRVQATDSRPYFLNGLFRQFILPETGLAGGSRRAAARTALFNGAGYVGCLLLLIGLIGWWSTNFASHKASLNAMRVAVADQQALLPQAQPQSGLASVLPALDEARHLARIETHDAVPGWLLDVAPLNITVARQAAAQNYDKSLQALLLPALLDRLHAQLQQAVATGADRQQIRSLLTTYLMFGDPTHYQRSAIATWMGAVVQADFALDPRRRTDAQDHVTRLLDLMPLPVTLDQALIENARAELREQPDVDVVYARLKSLALSSPSDPPLDVETALGAAGSQLLMLRTQAGLPVNVPGLYTREGFYQVYLTQAPLLASGLDATDWVLGGTGAAAQQGAASVLQAVTQLYVQDYVKQWQSVINQIGLRALPDLPSLAGGLQTMAGPDSPLTQLVTLIKRQTDLTPPPAPAPTGVVGEATKAAQGVAGGAAAALVQQAAKLTAPVAVPTDPQNWPGNAIRIPFQALQALLDTSNGGQAPAARMQNTLAAAYGVVSGVASAQAPDAAAQQIAGQVLSAQGADPLIPLRVQAATLPRPLDGIFRQLYSNIWGTFLQMTVNRIEASWARDVAPVCEQSIARRYPFVSPSDPAAGRDVALRDFSSFFGPNGTMDKFVAGNLTMFTIVGPDGKLALASQNGLSLGLGATALDQINRARAIRSLFFGPDGNLLVRFSLTPVYLDPRVLSATMQIDQTRMVYRHEPPQATPVTWPPTGDGGASFSLMTIGREVYQVQNDGTWAAFKLLLGASKADNANRSRLTVAFKLHDYDATYLLSTDSVSNPFVDRDFSDFRCVPRL